MDKKTTDILSYITIIGWIIAYCAGTKEQSKFHLNQGLVLSICSLAVSLISGMFGWIPLFGWILSALLGIVGIVLFVFMIIGIVNAADNKEVPLPLIGGIVILK